jgi:transcription elongation factor GreA
MSSNIITQDALDKMQAELEALKAKRGEITARIEAALAHGDLSENFEYHEAKDTQGMNESRIKELEHMIKNAQVVEKTTTGNVGLGSEVVVEVMGNEMTFEIVSFNQADPANGKISNESPIGVALLGHKAGDAVMVETPSGSQVEYKIVSVS